MTATPTRPARSNGPATAPRRSFPFGLPSGWFQVASADEVPPGGVLPLRYFDRDLVLWRTESGRVQVADAYCPHLGAHLGHGGAVEGEILQCPFHGWRFGAEGECVEVPYARRVPPRARLRTWPAVERNQMVLVWYHPEGKEPDFEVPEFEEVGHPDWTDYDRHQRIVRSRNQELGENSVDRAHFRYVHGTLMVPESEVTVEGPWRRSIQRADMKTPRGVVQGVIDSQSHGLGYSHIRFSGICDTLLVAGVTPIDEEHVDVRFSFVQKKVPGADPRGGVARAIVADIVKQLDEDIPIWEHKAYLERPLLCDGDGPIAEWRRWCRQFYAE